MGSKRKRKPKARNVRDLRKCPECIILELEGTLRIGNNRMHCKTCNSFGRRVDRAAVKHLKDEFKPEYMVIHDHIEAMLYEQLVDGLPSELFDPDLKEFFTLDSAEDFLATPEITSPQNRAHSNRSTMDTK